MKKKEEGIYTTHGKEEKLIATKAKVDGVLSLAFVKNGELISSVGTHKLVILGSNGFEKVFDLFVFCSLWFNHTNPTFS